LVVSDEIGSPIVKVFELEDAEILFNRINKNQQFGKIELLVGS